MEFKKKEKKCGICGVKFYIDSPFKLGLKYCSYNCRVEKEKERQKKKHEKMKEVEVKRKCKMCKKFFIGNALFVRRFCSNDCQYSFYKESRVGKENPNFRNGKYTHANFQNRKSKTAHDHLNACRRYKYAFIKEHGYQFCEVCGVNKMATSRFEVHHIYFASRYPKHKNLHDTKNMIHICKECHLKFHDGTVYSEVFVRLEEERGLVELFRTLDS